jgi:hypothetical protein
MNPENMNPEFWTIRRFALVGALVVLAEYALLFPEAFLYADTLGKMTVETMFAAILGSIVARVLPFNRRDGKPFIV